jgi:Pregnancy-associated plasma protein-A
MYYLNKCFFIFLFLRLVSLQQVTQAQTCGAVMPPNHNWVVPPSSVNPPATVSYAVPIHFHIITNANGDLPGKTLIGYNLTTHIRNVLNYANSAFQGTNISFYPSAFTYRISNALYDNGENALGLQALASDSKAINVYVVNGYGTGETGRAAYPNSDVLPNNYVSFKATTSTKFTNVLAHELGHYFNLAHTHDRTFFFGTKAIWPESDCNAQGDNICDTPQEIDVDAFCSSPGSICTSCIGNCSSTTPCTITSNGTTRTMTLAHDNIMSYHNISGCSADLFTPTQKMRMYNELRFNQYRSFLTQAPLPPPVPLPSNFASVTRNNTVAGFGNLPMKLSKTGTPEVSSTTPANGGPYNVDLGNFLPQNVVAKIEPTRNGTGWLATNNGISTADLIGIQQHILNAAVLPKPYAWIAADVNNSGIITTLDLIIIRKVILGEYLNFPDVPSWRFVPKHGLQNSLFNSEFNSDPFSAIWTYNGYYQGYNLANSLGPKTYFDDLEINLTEPTINQSSTFSFEAIKSGDVNFSATINNLPAFRNEGPSSELRSGSRYSLQSEDNECLEAGKSYLVGLGAKGDASVYAYQLGIKVNPQMLSLKSVDKGQSNYFSLDDFNLKEREKGILKTVWMDFEKNEKIKINEKKDLFQMLVMANTRICGLSQAISLDDQILENLIFDDNSRILNVDLWLTAKEVKKNDPNANQLVNVFPNPTSQELSFELNLVEKAKVELVLRDSQGKSIQVNRNLETGTQFIKLDNIQPLSSGMINYTLKIGAKICAGTVFKL